MWVSSALAVLLLAPALVRSQQPSATPTSPSPTPLPVSAPLVAPDSSALFERPNGTQIRPGAFVYDLILTRAGQITPLGLRTVQVVESQVGGAPAWLIAESRTGTVVPTSDSLWVTRGDLTPLRWVATIDRAQLGASFTRDSVFGALQSYAGRSSFSAAVPAGALVTPGMVERIVELLPLRVGYRASASVLVLDMSVARALPAELLVEREERVAAGGGEVECWVVVVRAGVMEQRLWVSKSALRVVRGEQIRAGGVVSAVLRP